VGAALAARVDAGGPSEQATTGAAGGARASGSAGAGTRAARACTRRRAEQGPGVGPVQACVCGSERAPATREQARAGAGRPEQKRGRAGLVRAAGAGVGASVGGGRGRVGACVEGPDARRRRARGERHAGVSRRRWLRLGAVRQCDDVRRS
jgi:hypothetical protein